MQCPLCHSHDCEIFHDDNQRTDKKFNQHRLYYQCFRCKLIYLEPKQLPTSDIEIKKYNEHTNNPLDQGYRAFLNMLIKPLMNKLDEADCGLDFGSGPGPTLSVIFKEHGFIVDDYDPYFKNDQELLCKTYDFITSTEVFEHFFEPKKELELLLNLLNPQGYLGVMTKLYNESIDFNNWYYRRDSTHVIFFTEETFKWISDTYSLRVEILGDNVIILQKE